MIHSIYLISYDMKVEAGEGGSAEGEGGERRGHEVEIFRDLTSMNETPSYVQYVYHQK